MQKLKTGGLIIINMQSLYIRNNLDIIITARTDLTRADDQYGL